MNACTEAGRQFKAIDITGAGYAQDFQLDDPDGRPRRLQDFRGKVVVVFFGYTHCPDVCPTSMAELAETKRLLGEDGTRLKGIFITLDPERDTPELLKAYMGSFDPDFLALAPRPEQLEALTKAFKLYYKKVPGKTAAGYTIDHSAGSYVYDPQGRVRLFTRYGSGAQALADDVKLLLQGV